MTSSSVRLRAPVTRVQRHRRPVRLSLRAPEVARCAQAGQFVSLGVEGAGTLLRRPYFLAGVGEDEVEVDVYAVGRASAWLAARQPGDHIDLTGPLGRPFPPEESGRRCLLVGDASVSTLRFLAAELHQRRAAVASIQVRGRDSLRRLELLMDARPSMVYAAGSRQLLATVCRAAVQRRVPCQVAVTEAMACGGLGVCWTCVVRVEGPPGTSDPTACQDVYVRTCVDGPVIDGAQVRLT